MFLSRDSNPDTLKRGKKEQKHSQEKKTGVGWRDLEEQGNQSDINYLL